MAGPSPEYLAGLASAFDAGAGQAGVTPMQFAPESPKVQPYGDVSLPGEAPIVLPGVQPAPALPPAGPPTAAQAAAAEPAQAQSGGPPAPPAEPAAPSGVDPQQVEFKPVGGGVRPAGELYARGPQQNAHLMASFDAPGEAAGRVTLRNALQAEQEELMYEAEADRAQTRQQAAERVALRRQAEMEHLSIDFQDQIQKLGQMKLNQGRWWGNQSTGDKIGNTLLVLMGGFFGGGNGALDRVSKQIDQDIEAQKFEYQAAADQAKGTQTAFGMLMDRYQSEDAATAAAKAAALEFTAARANAMRAKWKGTESVNDLDQFLAKLEAERQKTIAEGFKYIPASVSAPKYQMAFRGRVAPGTFTEAQAQQNFLKYQTDPAQKTDEVITKGEVDLGVGVGTARAKAQAEQAGKEKQFAVNLPNGETLYAPNEKIAERVRGLATSLQSSRQTLTQAKQLRSGVEWAVPGSGDRAALEALKADLITDFKTAKELGALSGPDMDLALAAVGEIDARSPAALKKLETYISKSESGLRNYLKTIPGAPEKSTGKMPGSFKPAGGK